VNRSEEEIYEAKILAEYEKSAPRGPCPACGARCSWWVTRGGYGPATCPEIPPGWESSDDAWWGPCFPLPDGVTFDEHFGSGEAPYFMPIMDWDGVLQAWTGRLVLWSPGDCHQMTDQPFGRWRKGRHDDGCIELEELARTAQLQAALALLRKFAAWRERYESEARELANVRDRAIAASLVQCAITSIAEATMRNDEEKEGGA